VKGVLNKYIKDINLDRKKMIVIKQEHIRELTEPGALYMPVISALWRLRYKDCKFEPSLDYRETSPQKAKGKK
jgi:hypothetical protein